MIDVAPAILFLVRLLMRGHIAAGFFSRCL